MKNTSHIIHNLKTRKDDTFKYIDASKVLKIHSFAFKSLTCRVHELIRLRFEVGNTLLVGLKIEFLWFCSTVDGLPVEA